MAMANSSRTAGATGLVLSNVFGLLGLITSFAELFVSSTLSMALKCARHRSSESGVYKIYINSEFIYW